MKLINKLILAAASTMTVNSFAVSTAATQEVDLDTLCRKFPLNSRCEDYEAAESEPKIYQLNRNSFLMQSLQVGEPAQRAASLLQRLFF